MSSTLEFKGYIGSVEYSSEDKCLFGKIEMIEDLVTFEASTVQELETNFQNAVNDYIETCKLLGREPQKAFKGVFNVRVNPEIHRKLYEEALRAGTSLNTFVKDILSQRVLTN
jgi:predicted HicB family RNase H-like nuclease